MIYFLEFPYLKIEVTSGKAEVATDCAKHRNVKAEVTSGKAEVATNYDRISFRLSKWT
ncbi:MAG: hypothetical protein V7K26_06390 [Nostoc sp.]|uniref:hypothetical protein n=1 Tax=Nostoc sp. TaxID=1180 RepID=UPI002FF81B6B